MNVVDLDAPVALAAARLSVERSLPMAGSVILATAQALAATLRTQDADPDRSQISAGGSAHPVAFVGHDGLRDFSLPATGKPVPPRVEGRRIVPAGASTPYYIDRIHEVGSHPVLLATGLMAPGAYTVDAAIRSRARGDSAVEVGEVAAAARRQPGHDGPCHTPRSRH